jgi:hypothetical protein
MPHYELLKRETEILQRIRLACPELLSLDENTETTPNLVSSIVARSHTLGLEAWRDKVQASIFSCLAYDRLFPHTTAIPSPMTTTTHQQRLKQVHTLLDQLDRFEQKESLSLLELAIWKAFCLSNMPTMTNYVDAMEWHACKWQSNKPKYQRSKASAVIVRAVLPFL